MKNLLQKWNSLSLIVRILIGLIIGAILGVATPKATGLALLGDLFVGALRAVAPILRATVQKICVLLSSFIC